MNGGIAHQYVVFARTGEGAGANTGTRGISAFLVPAQAPGLAVAERIETMALIAGRCPQFAGLPLSR